jgi:hypothetical protein
MCFKGQDLKKNIITCLSLRNRGSESGSRIAAANIWNVPNIRSPLRQPAAHLSIYLWTNKTLYDHVALRPVREEAGPQPLGLPDHMLVTEGQEAGAVEVEEGEVFSSPEQIGAELITFTNLSSSRWLNMLSLDTINSRKRPSAPLKKPRSAPFFLLTC